MYSRWFNVTVVLLWLATMSWLVRAKVLPLLEIGEPPSLPEIVAAQIDDPPVGWEILVDNKRLGWALTETRLEDSGMRNIRGRVHIGHLQLEKLIPAWLQPIYQLMVKSSDESEIDARCVLVYDSLGHLLNLDASMRMTPPDTIVGLSGMVVDGLLQLKIRFLGKTIAQQCRLPSKMLLSDYFSPQTKLPGLYEGREWTETVYSPLGSNKNPVKIVHASVEGREPILWNGAMENVWLVVYRDDTGSASDADRSQQGRMWVRGDGAVLQQETRLSNSTITFVRMSDRQAREAVKSAGKKWWAPETGAWVDNHD